MIGSPDQKLVLEVKRHVQPLLSGLNTAVHGAVLADLFALYLAGDLEPDAEPRRELLIKEFLSKVRKLVPIRERQIRARQERLKLRK